MKKVNILFLGNKTFDAYLRKGGNIDLYLHNSDGKDFLVQFADNKELKDFIDFLKETKKVSGE